MKRTQRNVAIVTVDKPQLAASRLVFVARTVRADTMWTATCRPVRRGTSEGSEGLYAPVDTSKGPARGITLDDYEVVESGS